MSLLLKIIGIIWAVIGFANLYSMPWDEASSGVQVFGLMFNMLLFILPGLIVYGVGAAISKKKDKVNSKQENLNLPSASPKSIEDRLKRLDELKERNLLSQDEYDKKRKEIISEV